MSITLVTHFQLPNHQVFPKSYCICSPWQTTTMPGFKGFELHAFPVYMEISTKTFPPIHRNIQRLFWMERILLLDVSWVKAGYYLKFEQTWPHLLLKRILPVFFSLWECSPWPISNVREVPSRLSMMSSVMGSDIYKLFKWLCRGREMPQGQHRSLMHTCAGKQGGEDCYLPKTNIYQTLTPLESLQETSKKKKKKH